MTERTLMNKVDPGGRWTRPDPGTDIMRNKIDLIVCQSMMIQKAQEQQAQVVLSPCDFYLLKKLYIKGMTGRPTCLLFNKKFVNSGWIY